MISVKRQMPEVLKHELDLGSAVESLEERAAVLEKDFNAMLKKADDLLLATTRYVDKQETESQCWKLLESILEAAGDSRDILDHVRVFFQFVLAQMKSRGADILDVKMLWHLHDNEDVKPTFLTAVNQFGFGSQDLQNLKLLLALTYKLQTDMERENSDDLAGDVDATYIALDQMDDKEIDQFLKDSRNLMGNIRSEDMQEILSYIAANPKADKGTADHEAVKENKDETDEEAKCGIINEKINKEEIYHGDATTTGIAEDPKPESWDNTHTTLDHEISQDRDKEQVVEDHENVEANEDGDIKERSTDIVISHPMKKGTHHSKRIETPMKSASKHLPTKKRLRRTLQAWGVDKRLQETIMRIMYTVLWMLNVGRKQKNLSIVNPSLAQQFCI